MGATTGEEGSGVGEKQGKKAVRVRDKRRARPEELGSAAKVQTSSLKPAGDGTTTADDARAAPADITRFFAVDDVLTHRPGDSVIEQFRAKGMDVVAGEGSTFLVVALKSAAPLVESAPASTPEPEPEPELPHDPAGIPKMLDDVFCARCGAAVSLVDVGTVCERGHEAPGEIGFWEAARLQFDTGTNAEHAADRMCAETEPLIEAWARWTKEREALAQAASSIVDTHVPLSGGAAAIPAKRPYEAPQVFPGLLDAARPAVDTTAHLSRDELADVGLCLVVGLAFDVTTEEAARRLREVALALRRTALKP